MRLTGEQTLVARGAVGVVGAVASLVLVSLERLRTVTDEVFGRLAVGGFVVSRLGLFGLVFLVLHIQPRGDIGFYWDQARQVMHGLLPYRDFVSSYAPLHPYLDTLPLRIWYSELAIMLMAVVAECALFPLWIGIGRRLFPEQELRRATLFYLANPMSLIFVCIDGQNNVLIALMLACAVTLLIRRSETLSGAMVALAMGSVKILALLFTPVFFLSTPRRWRWALGAVVVSAVVYGGALALHMPILQPLKQEGAIRTAGNLPYGIETLVGRELPARLWDGLVLLGLGGVVLFVLRVVRGQTEATRLRVITFAMPAIILALVLLSKKGWPNYLILVLFPLCLLTRRMGRVGMTLFSLFGTLAVVEHSYWATLFSQANSVVFHGLLFEGHFGWPRRAAVDGLGVLEVLLIAGYCWLLVRSLGEIGAAPFVVETAKDLELNRAAV